MKKFLFILLSFLVTSSIFGQSHFGLRADLGISRFYDRQDELKIYPAAQGGFFYEINLGQNSTLGGELIHTQIKTMDKDQGYVTTGNNTDLIATRTNYHISYLSIPIYYGVKFSDISANFGIVPIYRYNINWKNETTINGIKKTETRRYKTSFTDDIDIGARITVAYQFNDRINLEVQYYFDFNKIIGDDIYVSFTDRVGQAVVGIKYALNKQE